MMRPESLKEKQLALLGQLAERLELRRVHGRRLDWSAIAVE